MQVVLAVGEIGRSVDFYERAFGRARADRLRELRRVPAARRRLRRLVRVRWVRPGCRRELGADPGGRVAPAYVYVRVNDVAAAVARVEAAGGRPLSPLASHSWGEDAAWFADPDGNVIAVAQSSAADDRASS